MSATNTRDATRQAFLTAVASVVSLVLAEWLELEHANLAVWTTYMVMVQFAFTRFQKGLERLVGRGLGILAGLALTTWFNETSLVAVGLISGLLTVSFYLYFAGRLAYTFLNTGLYVVVMFQIGHANPAAPLPQAEGLFAAVVVGVVAADLVTWLAGAERDLGIRLGNEPLWPVRFDWLNQSLMLAVTVLLTVVGAAILGRPAEQAAVSVLLLTVAPHIQALLLKGELRIAGLLLAAAWAAATFLLVSLLPHFPLLAALLFLGQFVAAYLARVGGQYAYAGVQMGLVLPLVVVASRGEFGSITPAIQRLEGVVLGLATSLLVTGLWPFYPYAGADAVLPAPPVFPAQPDR